jgi:hypothetical protein
MQRRGLFRANKKLSEEFPFEIDENASFLIKNETTNEERLFPYSEVIDGTYDTWLNGANGGVLEWRVNNMTLSSGWSTYMRLISNNGNPYLNDYDQLANLGQLKEIDMSQDWIITIILDKELNSNPQRLNLGVRGSGSNLFALQLKNNGEGFVVIDRLTGGTGVPDHSFNYPYTNDFKLFTFSRIGGSFNIEINNTGVTLGTASYYTNTETVTENSMVLGSRQFPNSGGGKITNYQHLKVLTGDLTGFDKSAYNQAIMTKYGI